MKKHILHIPYSKHSVCNGAHGIHCVRNTFRTRNTSRIHSLFIWCGIGLLWLCTACTEQDEFSSATLQPLTFIIDEPLPFQEMTAGSGNTAAQPSGRDDSHARSHTRIADSGKAVSWENNDKIYLAAAITVSTSTTYAYSTATYNGSTKMERAHPAHLRPGRRQRQCGSNLRQRYAVRQHHDSCGQQHHNESEYQKH